MTIIKSYTNLEQSKELAKILPIESADMGFYYSFNPQAARNQMWVGTKAENADIPCWSLVALLEILPPGKILLHDKSGLGYKCIYKDIDTNFHKNSVDACVELIVKLKKENML